MKTLAQRLCGKALWRRSLGVMLGTGTENDKVVTVLKACTIGIQIGNRSFRNSSQRVAIDLGSLIDLDSVYASGGTPYTFFAWPSTIADEHGLPTDPEAILYISAFQSAGVTVGIWRNSPTPETVYAGVTRESIPTLNRAISEMNQFEESFVTELTDRLFGTAPPGSGE